MRRTIVRLPQDNPNDTKALLVEWLHKDQLLVEKGSIICLVESTKAIYEVEAEVCGYLIPLLDAGKEAAVGDVIAVLSESEKDTVELVQSWIMDSTIEIASNVQFDQSLDLSLVHKATKKAEMRAKELGVNLENMPIIEGRITEKHVLDFYKNIGKHPASPVQHASEANLIIRMDVYPEQYMQKVLIVGAGTGSVQIIDALKDSKTQVPVAMLDDTPEFLGKSVMSVPIIGGIRKELVLGLLAKGEIDAVVIAITHNHMDFRMKLFMDWKESGVPFANIIHEKAHVASNVSMGQGNIILSQAYIGPSTKMGGNNFISSNVSIDHHCQLGDCCAFGPGVVTSGCVTIGSNVMFGTGIFVEPRVAIGSNSVVASGCIITKSVPDFSHVKHHSNITVHTRG